MRTLAFPLGVSGLARTDQAWDVVPTPAGTLLNNGPTVLICVFLAGEGSVASSGSGLGVSRNLRASFFFLGGGWQSLPQVVRPRETLQPHDAETGFCPGKSCLCHTDQNPQSPGGDRCLPTQP